MPPKSKSLFRQPGAKHFQLVHRSQRDPLAHDPDSSQHVLKEIERGNNRKGKSRIDLELSLPPELLDHVASRSNLGEAAAYGIFFDDTEYDYMQHLRRAGVHEDGVDSVLIDAPLKPKGKGKETEPISLIDIPVEVLPSKIELPRNYEAQESVPSSIAGFQPDMDLHLRQVLEALEDDAFVDDDLDDDFFGEMVAAGERDPNEAYPYEFHEDGIHGAKMADAKSDASGGDGEGWEARYQTFKSRESHSSDNGEDTHSEGGDTIGTLPRMSVVGAKRRRKGVSDASGYSMSSSSMFRNEGLTALDEQFDHVNRTYSPDSDDDAGEQDDDAESIPELISTREDFDAIMNEFLDNYEVLGGKMHPVLPGNTPTEKLDTIRKGLRDIAIEEREDANREENPTPFGVDSRKDRWDCETVLTTRSNLDNHPRLIRARAGKVATQVPLHPKTGLPLAGDSTVSSPTASVQEVEPRSTRVTVSRSRNETREEKRLRKQTVKSSRQERRAEKKTTKAQFAHVVRHEVGVAITKEKVSSVRKL